MFYIGISSTSKDKIKTESCNVDSIQMLAKKF